MLKKLVFLFVVASVVLTACGGGAAPAEPAAVENDSDRRRSRIESPSHHGARR